MPPVQPLASSEGTGDLTADELKSVFAASKPALRKCFHQNQAAHPDATLALLKVDLVIAPSVW